MSQNTLFSYFKTPPKDSDTHPSSTPESSPAAVPPISGSTKRKLQVETERSPTPISDSLEEALAMLPLGGEAQKRPLDDQETEPVLVKTSSNITNVSLNSSSSDDEDEMPLAQRFASKKRRKLESGTEHVIEQPNNPLESFTFGSKPVPRDNKGKSKAGQGYSTAPATSYKDTRYEWLINVRDKQGRSVNDKDYDPRTLYIPKNAWDQFSNFERQFWEIKSTHYDTVVFFKKGKFYELYESDADVGHKLLDLKMTDRVNMRMCGVPEKSFDPWAAKLLGLGYKVAKVDQIGNATSAKIQNSKSKVLRRELAAVLTQGTLVDDSLINDPAATYLLTVKENPETCEYGVCFVDSATAEFNIGFFKDDERRTQFETLILQVNPKEVVLEKGTSLSWETKNIMKRHLMSPIMNHLAPGSEFWDREQTLGELSAYFENMPQAVTALSENELAMSAFGATIWYLRTLQLDRDLLTVGNVRSYKTMRDDKYMTLDGPSLHNLEILHNNTRDRGMDGSLLQLLQSCDCAFGKRLFKRWLCHPLCRLQDIQERSQAVGELVKDQHVRSLISGCVRGLPDLERLISRIHAGRLRAAPFVQVLNGFRSIGQLLTDLADPFNHSGFESQTLKGICVPGNSIPSNLLDQVSEMEGLFDYKEATINDIIYPVSGVNEEFDTLIAEVRQLEGCFEEYLQEQRQATGIAKLKYKHIQKEKYQLEVPVSLTKSLPEEYQMMSNTKTVKRYWTPQIRKWVSALTIAKEKVSMFQATYIQYVLEQFDSRFDMWSRVVGAIAELDCLNSIATVSDMMPEPKCRAEFVRVEEGVTPFLSAKELRHPCLVKTIADSFIPNDVELGGQQPGTMVITGPNMGGKSTLLRMVCVSVIMAQLGCSVAAKQFSLTPVDRIYTRLGANDDIMAGQSTFMVELQETSSILRLATENSLVILDELGRGTSTYDGYSIAYAVLRHLTEKTLCRTLFATHYHTLCDVFGNNPNVALKHMSFLIGENDHDVTFLYRLKDGSSKQSFGLNVGRMAGIPTSILNEAEKAGELFKRNSKYHELKANRLTETEKGVLEILFDGESAVDKVKEAWKGLKDDAMVLF